MKATSVKEVLTAMLWIYENKLEHTTGASYRDSFGNYVNQASPDNIDKIKSCCIAGCVWLVETDRPILTDTYQAIRRHLGTTSCTEWNDNPANKVDKKKVILLLKEIISHL
ncbi:MAG TPA: hypothetical protein VII94_03540 [Candidatus Saccharimonadales bacterium]